MSRSKIIRAEDFQAPLGLASPLDIPGAFLWLDAANIGAGIDADPVNLDPVTTWRDKSGNSHDFVAIGTGADRPTFLSTGLAGQPTVQIDGTQHGLRATPGFAKPNGPVTCAFVGQQTGGTFYNIDVLADARFLYWLNNPAQGNWYFRDAFLGSPGVAESSILYSVAVFDEDRVPTAELRVNGTSIRSDAGYTNHSWNDTTTVGSRYTGEALNNWAGFMSEWILYDFALSQAQIAQLEGYFATKWGII